MKLTKSDCKKYYENNKDKIDEYTGLISVDMGILRRWNNGGKWPRYIGYTETLIIHVGPKGYMVEEKIQASEGPSGIGKYRLCSVCKEIFWDTHGGNVCQDHSIDNMELEKY